MPHELQAVLAFFDGDPALNRKRVETVPHLMEDDRQPH